MISSERHSATRGNARKRLMPTPIPRRERPGQPNARTYTGLAGAVNQMSLPAFGSSRPMAIADPERLYVSMHSPRCWPCRCDRCRS